MHPHYQQLLNATQAMLEGKSYPEKVTGDFFQVAHENALSGALYSVLSADLDNHIKDKFKQDFFAYNALDVKQLATKETLSNLLNNAHIKHVFLKGVILKKLYPQSYMRSMGDIDLIIEEHTLKDAHQALTEAGFKRTGIGDPHHNYEANNHVKIELHHHLQDSTNETYANVLNRVWEETTHIKAYAYQLNPEFELAYLTFHAAKHLINSGIGLRSILDFGIYASAFSETLNLKKLNALLQEMNLELLFKNIMWLNQRYFGLNPLPKIIISHHMDDLFYETLTDYIMRSGIHGIGIGFNNFVGRITKSKNKFHFLLKIIFPKYQTLTHRYPYLHKHPYLLGLAWLKHLYTLVFIRRRRSITRLKQLNQQSKDLEKTKDLYQKLGV